MFPEMIQEFTELNQKALVGLNNLSNLTEDDIQYGMSEKEVVYSDNKMKLYRYKPLGDVTLGTPLLISYALVNRPHMVDLQEDRSLVQNLNRLGVEVYMIDWGYPTRADRWLTLDDYINGYLDDCVDVVRERHNLDKINLFGICQGGVFSTCYTALHSEKIKNLVLTVTPIDFSVKDALLNHWSVCNTGGDDEMNVDLMVDAFGNIPGDFMNFGFVTLKPFALNLQKYYGLLDASVNKKKLANFMRMEKWIFDSPDQAGEAYRQFMKDFYQSNKLIKGEVEIGGQRVDLKNITQPVLNIYAEQDHLVPPSSTKALENYVGTEDYTVTSYPVGHIGMYVSGKVQRTMPPTVVDWLKERE